MIRREYTLSQINSYAMLHGIYMGIWGIATWAFCLLNFINNYSLGILTLLLFLFTPYVAYRLTIRYRTELPNGHQQFSLTQGFLHTFLTFFYGSLWVALAAYIYIAHFENGAIANTYSAYFSSPEVAQLLEQPQFKADFNAMLGGQTIDQIVETIRTLPPIFYVLMCINTNLVWSPILSLIIAFFTRRTNYK